MERITSIEVFENKLIVHRRQEIDLAVREPGFEPLNHFWNHGFIKIIPSWEGFGYGLQKGVGWWLIDVKEKKVLRETENPLLEDQFVYSKAISVNEYGISTKGIPIIRKCKNE